MQMNLNNNIAATEYLQAFINQVNAFIRGRKLTVAQGQPLIDKANESIAALGSGPIFKKQTASETVPTEFGMEQNYLNPFNPSQLKCNIENL